MPVCKGWLRATRACAIACGAGGGTVLWSRHAARVFCGRVVWCGAQHSLLPAMCVVGVVKALCKHTHDVRTQHASAFALNQAGACRGDKLFPPGRSHLFLCCGQSTSPTGTETPHKQRLTLCPHTFGPSRRAKAHKRSSRRRNRHPAAPIVFNSLSTRRQDAGIGSHHQQQGRRGCRCARAPSGAQQGDASGARAAPPCGQHGGRGHQVRVRTHGGAQGGEQVRVLRVV